MSKPMLCGQRERSTFGVNLLIKNLLITFFRHGLKIIRDYFGVFKEIQKVDNKFDGMRHDSHHHSLTDSRNLSTLVSLK